MSNYPEDKKIINTLIKEARRCMDEDYYEEAISKLQKCLSMDIGLKDRMAVFNELGYCFLRLGWYEDAVKIYNQILEVNPSDNDSRFFRASAYLSLKWTDEAIQELKTILASDSTDILARHDLALCYRAKGWMQESLEEMRSASEYAQAYGSPDERKVIKSSVKNLEEEIETGGDDETREALLKIIFALIIKRRLSLEERTR